MELSFHGFFVSGSGCCHLENPRFSAFLSPSLPLPDSAVGVRWSTWIILSLAWSVFPHQSHSDCSIRFRTAGWNTFRRKTLSTILHYRQGSKHMYYGALSHQSKRLERLLSTPEFLSIYFLMIFHFSFSMTY